MALDGARQKKLEDLIALLDRSEISSIKTVVKGVLNVINDPRSSAKDLKDLVEIDPPLTAKVLKVANSALHASLREISEIQHAVIWIGFDALKELVLSQKVCEIFLEDTITDGYSRTSLWKHSNAVALFAKLIFRREFGKRGENVYAAGLLHDIGIIVEDQFLQAEFRDILEKARAEKRNLSAVEREVLGYTHEDLGKAITAHWAFPEELISAIGHHHNPEGVSKENERIASTLYVADYLCHERGIGYSDAPFRDTRLFKKCLRNLEIGAYALDLIVKDGEQKIREMEEQGLFQNDQDER